MNAAQQQICHQHNVQPDPPAANTKVGIATNTRSDLRPINGLRHRPEGDTNGWYIWAGGEPGTAEDFFEPLHIEHVAEWCPEVVPFLALPPGWRFLVAGPHVDVWFDPALLLE